MKKLAIILVLSSVVFTISCERKTETFDPSKFGYDYFPLEIGNSAIYRVDSIIYDDEGTTVLETSSFIKEDVVEKFTDGTGDEIYRIERYWKDSLEMEEWQVTDVWTAFTDESRAFRTEENLKFVKLVFPALQGKFWDSNVFVDENIEILIAGEPVEMFKGYAESEIVSLDEKEEVGGKNYDQVVTIVADDNNNNSIERRYALEKYARGVGLIYKEYVILNTQNGDTSIPWEDKATEGFILKQTLVEHN